MKIDISQAIIAYLRARDEVSIPGIGSFTFLSKDAKLSLGHTSIFPPTTHVVFSDKTGNGEHFTRFLQDEYGLSAKKADKLIKKYTSKILNKLLNLGSAHIPGLGNLVQKTESGLVFIPENDGFNHEAYGLRPLDIHPVVRTGTEKKESLKKIIAPVEPVAVTPRKKRENNDFSESVWPSLILILVLSTLLLLLAIWLNGPGVGSLVSNKEFVHQTENDANESGREVKELQNDENNADQNFISPTDEGVENQEGKLMDSSSDVPQEEYESRSADDPEDGLSSSDRPQEETEESSQSDDSTSKTTSDGDKSAVAEDNLSSGQQTQSVQDLDSATLEHLTNHPNLIKYKDILSWDALEVGCVIIVGSFRNKRNAIRMQSKIINAGLQPYTSYFEGHTRVGIIFECKDHDLEGYIDTIRSQFHPKAWYLVPELFVER